jgi:hypothetical protein
MSRYRKSDVLDMCELLNEHSGQFFSAADAVKVIELAQGFTAMPVEPELEEVPEYVYFVSFTFGDVNGSGSGSSSIWRTTPITSWADVEDVTAGVAAKHQRNGHPVRRESVVILNFILLSGPKGNPS